jgi:hypothetical protein
MDGKVGWEFGGLGFRAAMGYKGVWSADVLFDLARFPQGCVCSLKKQECVLCGEKIKMCSVQIMAMRM